MKYLFIINDAPYGTEKAYNALRLAMQFQKESSSNSEANEIRIFLMADAATCALPNQVTPSGYYNVESDKVIIFKKNHFIFLQMEESVK